MQQRLALARPAEQVALLAMCLDLADMPADLPPAPDLAGIVLHAAAEMVAAIPLEPAARVVRVDPALGAPHSEGLAGADAEEIERRVPPLRRQLRPAEPRLRELVPAIGHVFAAEHAEPQQLGRRQLGPEGRIEVAADGLAHLVAVALLHPVVDDDDVLAHVLTLGPDV